MSGDDVEGQEKILKTRFRSTTLNKRLEIRDKERAESSSDNGFPGPLKNPRKTRVKTHKIASTPLRTSQPSETFYTPQAGDTDEPYTTDEEEFTDSIERLNLDKVDSTEDSILDTSTATIKEDMNPEEQVEETIHVEESSEATYPENYDDLSHAEQSAIDRKMLKQQHEAAIKQQKQFDLMMQTMQQQAESLKAREDALKAREEKQNEAEKKAKESGLTKPNWAQEGEKEQLRDALVAKLPIQCDADASGNQARVDPLSYQPFPYVPTVTPAQEATSTKNLERLDLHQDALADVYNYLNAERISTVSIATIVDELQSDGKETKIEVHNHGFLYHEMDTEGRTLVQNIINAMYTHIPVYLRSQALPNCLYVDWGLDCEPRIKKTVDGVTKYVSTRTEEKQRRTPLIFYYKNHKIGELALSNEGLDAVAELHKWGKIPPNLFLKKRLGKQSQECEKYAKMLCNAANTYLKSNRDRSDIVDVQGTPVLARYHHFALGGRNYHDIMLYTYGGKEKKSDWVKYEEVDKDLRTKYFQPKKPDGTLEARPVSMVNVFTALRERKLDCTQFEVPEFKPDVHRPSYVEADTQPNTQLQTYRAPPQSYVDEYAPCGNLKQVAVKMDSYTQVPIPLSQFKLMKRDREAQYAEGQEGSWDKDRKMRPSDAKTFGVERKERASPYARGRDEGTGQGFNQRGARGQAGGRPFRGRGGSAGEGQTNAGTAQGPDGNYNTQYQSDRGRNRGRGGNRGGRGAYRGRGPWRGQAGYAQGQSSNVQPNSQGGPQNASTTGNLNSTARVDVTQPPPALPQAAAAGTGTVGSGNANTNLQKKQQLMSLISEMFQ